MVYISIYNGLFQDAAFCDKSSKSTQFFKELLNYFIHENGWITYFLRTNAEYKNK